MFERQTIGLARIGGEESHLPGSHLVIGVADSYGNVIGWFGDQYHPNEQLSVQVGADDEGYAPDAVQLVMGFADDAEDNIIGWSLGKLVKKIGKAVASPITAPIKAVSDIAKGKNVLKSVVKSVAAPLAPAADITRVVSRPLAKVAAAPVRFVFGKKAGTAVKGIVSAPSSALSALQRGSVKGVLRAGVQPVTSGLKLTAATARPFVATASRIAQPLVGKKVARGLTNITQMPFTSGAKTLDLLAQGKIAKGVKTSIVDPLKASASLARPTLKLAAPILKSKVTAAIVTGVALAFPPIGVPLAAGYAAARVALPYATTALAAADKVLAAAKGTLPSMAQAPAGVAAALQETAKLTIGKTYQAANMGSEDASRALEILTIAKKVQAAVPAAQASIHPLVSMPSGSVQQAPLVQKRNGEVLRGMWRKVDEGGTHSGPIVLRDGTVIAGAWDQVA
jgi:hypothetical protein